MDGVGEGIHYEFKGEGMDTTDGQTKDSSKCSVGETVTVQLTRESFEFLKSLAAEVASQNNRGTAAPYFLALRVNRSYPTDGQYDYDGVYFCDKHGQQWNSMAELLKNEPEHRSEEITEVYYKVHKEVENVFLTERALLEHIRVNGHNLPHLSEPRGYLFHAFRNSELSGLFKAIGEFK